MQGHVDPYARQAVENKRYFSVGLALLAIALGLGLVGAGLFGAGRIFNGPMVQTLGQRDAALTPATGANVPLTKAAADDRAVTVAPDEVKLMPKDVLDWLKHLEKTERMRKDMAGRQVSELMVQFTMLQGAGATEEVMKGLLGDDPDVEGRTPANEIGDQAEKQKQAWRELTTFFDSVPPPPECVTTRNAYAQCLGETQAMLTEVLEAIGQASDDTKAALNALVKLRGKSGGRIDAAGRQTDSLVQDICDKYEARKWFSISGDVGGGLGGILGK